MRPCTLLFVLLQLGSLALVLGTKEDALPMMFPTMSDIAPFSPYQQITEDEVQLAQMDTPFAQYPFTPPLPANDADQLRFAHAKDPDVKTTTITEAKKPDGATVTTTTKHGDGAGAPDDDGSSSSSSSSSGSLPGRHGRKRIITTTTTTVTKRIVPTTRMPGLGSLGNSIGSSSFGSGSGSGSGSSSGSLMRSRGESSESSRSESSRAESSSASSSSSSSASSSSSSSSESGSRSESSRSSSSESGSRSESAAPDPLDKETNIIKEKLREQRLLEELMEERMRIKELKAQKRAIEDDDDDDEGSKENSKAAKKSSQSSPPPPPPGSSGSSESSENADGLINLSLKINKRKGHHGCNKKKDKLSIRISMGDDGEDCEEEPENAELKQAKKKMDRISRELREKVKKYSDEERWFNKASDLMKSLAQKTKNVRLHLRDLTKDIKQIGLEKHRAEAELRALERKGDDDKKLKALEATLMKLLAHSEQIKGAIGVLSQKKNDDLSKIEEVRQTLQQLKDERQAKAGTPPAGFTVVPQVSSCPCHLPPAARPHCACQ